ncbi:hypothetical protein E2C01_006393 [Portunus trituberculatus]|uniref:Uncharacterized protein n=1 Tax=Portunus trituberculatus TaxID=210409 RepID=A0A5B7CXS2_PORTR|nr:hypothetical protein [Portunus trituberculatus]
MNTKEEKNTHTAFDMFYLTQRVTESPGSTQPAATLKQHSESFTDIVKHLGAVYTQWEESSPKW